MAHPPQAPRGPRGLLSRLMPGAQKPSPQAGPPMRQMPRMPMGMPGMPGSQSLGGGQGLQVSPDQLNAIKSQLPPELRGDFDKWFSDPQVQADLGKMQEMAAQGQFNPAMMQQMMGQMGAGGGGLPGMPGLPGAGGMMPPQAGNAGPGQGGGGNPLFDSLRGATQGTNPGGGQLVNILLGTGAGFGVGTALNWMMHHVQSGSVDWPLTRLGRIPPFSWLNDSLKNYMDMVPEASRNQNAVLRMMGEVPPEAYERGFFTTRFGGPDVGYMPEIGKALDGYARKGEILKHLMERVQSPAQLAQLTSPSIVNFLPAEVRELGQTGIVAKYVTGPVYRATEVLPNGVRRWFGRNVNWVAGQFRPENPTLGQLDRLAEVHHLKDVAATLLKDHPDVLAKVEGTLIPAMGIADKAEKAILQAVKEAPQLAEKLGLKADALSFTAIRDALAGHATEGRQSVAEALKYAEATLLTKALPSDWAKLTLAEAEKHFAAHHVAAAANPAGLVQKGIWKKLQGIWGRVPYLSGKLPAIVEDIRPEYLLHSELKARGVGPAGRVMAQGLQFFQRVFSGKTITSKYEMTRQLFPELMSMAFMSYFTFGLAIGAYRKAPEETRKSRFFHSLAESVGGFMGWEIGRHLWEQLRIGQRWPRVTQFLDRRLLPIIPLTRMGLAKEVFSIFVVGGALGYAFTKLSNLIFGNPETKELAIKAKTDAHPLQTEKNLFNKLLASGTEGSESSSGGSGSSNAGQSASGGGEGAEHSGESKKPKQKWTLSPSEIAESPFDQIQHQRAKDQEQMEHKLAHQIFPPGY